MDVYLELLTPPQAASDSMRRRRNGEKNTPWKQPLPERESFV